MRPSNLKVTSDPGFSVGKRILFGGVIFCFLVFFSLVYADGPDDPNNPFGEHPWDELLSGSDHQPPRPPGITTVIISPCGNFDGWIIIHFRQAKDGGVEKEQIQKESSEKIQAKSFILF